MTTTPPLVRVERLRTWFPIGGGVMQKPHAHVKAVDDVSFDIRRGEVLGVVGESGSGKSTLGRTILGLIPATDGEVRFDGIDVRKASAAALRALRRRMQIVFQDPFSSLNPRLRVGNAIEEALIIHGLHTGPAARRARVEELLGLVGLLPHYADRFPHEFSGGQRQRIGIARTLAVEPDFIVADEPVSALDVSVQAQVINLLQDLRERFALTMMFVAHDLAVVRMISDRIAVMYLGHIVELADTDDLFAHPAHPYTEALLSAVPVPDPTARRGRIILTGDVPSPIDPPSGCVFRSRCRHATGPCAQTAPRLVEVAPGHHVACLLHADAAAPSDIHPTRLPS
jgi:oligopeptide/dipeptide ABC transporter ATP-binding protein